MTPNTVSEDAVTKLNKGMQAVLTLQARLCCVKSAETIPDKCSDYVLMVRFWLTANYNVVVRFDWSERNGRFDWYPTMVQSPSLADVLLVLQDRAHVLNG